jgi:hypothetical protein
MRLGTGQSGATPVACILESGRPSSGGHVVQPSRDDHGGTRNCQKESPVLCLLVDLPLSRLTSI